MQAVHPMRVRPVRLPAQMVVRPSPGVYGRRRLAVLLCAAAVLCAGWVGVHQLTGLSGGGPLTTAGQPVRHIDAELATQVRTVVQPGDTLWSLARRAQPRGDIRPLVQTLDARRHGQPLQAGETLIISLRK